MFRLNKSEAGGQMKIFYFSQKCNFFRYCSFGLYQAVTVFFMMLCSLDISAQNKWVGTWSTAPYAVGSANMPPSPGLTNNTLRQIVRVSIGGDSIRVKFSNSASANAITMNSVTVAVSPTGKDTIDVSTLKQLRFNSNSKITIDAESTVYSDPVAFHLTPSTRVAITIYYGQTPSDLTGHVGSRTPSYLLSGDKTMAGNFGGAIKTEHWYTINTIDVLAPSTAGAVAIIGNSITDGYGLTGGLQNRWTDVFSEALLKNADTKQTGVLNMGIGGTLITTSGKSRYQQDILGQQGLRWIIIFYGINDINADVSAATVIDTYKKMITDAHAKDANIKVYGATITPENGSSYYTSAREAVRSTINKWIRTSGNFDGCIDFDKVIRDPNDTTRMNADLRNDWLHPNVAGYKVLGESVDLKLFMIQSNVMNKGRLLVNEGRNLCTAYHNGVITFEIPQESFVSLKLYSMLGKQMAEFAGRQFSSGRHSLIIKDKKFSKGMYLYLLKINELSVGQKIVY